MDFLLNTFVSVTLYDTDKEEILDGALDVCREYENVLVPPSTQVRSTR